MSAIELIWPPFPHRAGFCITDDTDAATLHSVSIVYDFMAAVGLVASKTVWVFTPAEPCGIPPLPDSIRRGITLEDPEYRAYCARLAERGFEICLHGASAGNNVRDRTARALELVEREFDRPGTYICHAKNAENIYWHEKVAPRPLQPLLAPASRYRCSGEQPSSPYFWGDLCLDRVRHIRLFRTRNTNTLADNPSMPYHDPEKPLVRSWFSATKRSFHDCTTPESLDGLVRDGGLCVLYQYMHRYADLGAGRPDPTFAADAERLMSTPGVWVATTSAIMDRRRRIQAVELAVEPGGLWVVNTGEEPIDRLQLSAPADAVGVPGPGARREGGVIVIDRLESGAMIRLPLTGGGVPDAIRLDGQGTGRRRFAFGEVLVNAGREPWVASSALRVEPGSSRVVYDRGYEWIRPRSRAAASELYRLLFGQFAIIGREVLLKGRSMDSRKFLGDETILLEDHANW